MKINCCSATGCFIASAAGGCLPLVVITVARHRRDDLNKLEPVLRLRQHLRACAGR